MTPRSYRKRARVWRLALLLAAFGVALAGLYLVFGLLLLPARLRAFAEAHDSTVVFSRFASLYPGDLRIARAELSSSPWGLTASAGPIRGRFRILPLLRGSFELVWVDVKQVDLRRATAAAQLMAHVEPVQSLGREAVEASINESPRAASSGQEGLTIQHAELDLHAADLGSFRLLGPVHAILDGVELGPSARRVNGSVEFRRLRLQRRGKAASVQAEVAGKAQFHLADSPLASRMSSTLAVELQWKSLDIGALIGAEARLRSTEGRLHSMLRSDSATGVLAGSSIDVQCEGLRISAQAFAENVHARVEFGLRPSEAAETPLTLAVQSPRVTVARNGVAQAFELSAESRARLENIEPESLMFDMATVRATRTENAPQQATPKQPLGVELAFARGSWDRTVGFTLQGNGTARGGNAQALIELAQLGPSATWLESNLSDQPFIAEWALNMHGPKLVLKDIWVQTPRDELRGALYLADGSANGAFLVKRGKLNLGLELRAGALDLELRADPAWLARSLMELESANAP